MGKRELPLIWKGADGARIQDKASVIMPDSNEVASFGSAQVQATCGLCRHFRGPEKDRPAVDQFVVEAVHEHGWKKGFLGDRAENLGRCTENATLVTGPNSAACSHFNERRGRIR